MRQLGWASQAVAREGCRRFFARKHSVAETGIDSENFIVSEARLKSQLGYDVRRRIERIVGDRAASGTGRHYYVVLKDVASADRRVIETAAGSGQIQPGSSTRCHGW